MIGVFSLLVMTRRVSALAAMILTPVAFALFAGMGDQLGAMAVEGLKQLVPIIVMITFAVLYFSLMLDAGLFDPLVSRTIALTRDDPVRIAIGTALLGLIIAFSGDGISTGLIMILAFLPVYRRVGMDAALLGTLVAIAIAVQNLSPWGGPLPRAAAVLQVDPMTIYLPLLPVLGLGAVALVVVAYILGKREAVRLQERKIVPTEVGVETVGFERDVDALRPEKFWLNAVLTIFLILGLITGITQPLILFPVAAAIAMLINYPSLSAQRARLARHADNIATFVLLFFAAGIFTGILDGSGMIKAMADVSVAVIPAGIGQSIALLAATLSVPMTYFLPNDAFFFGALPVLAETGRAFGISPEIMAAASILGQPVHVFSPILPSLYFFCAMLDVDVGRFLRFGLPWAMAVSVVMIGAAIALGIVPVA